MIEQDTVPISRELTKESQIKEVLLKKIMNHFTDSEIFYFPKYEDKL